MDGTVEELNCYSQVLQWRQKGVPSERTFGKLSVNQGYVVKILKGAHYFS